MKHAMFVYGTLTFPEIVYTLTGKLFRSEDAQAANHFVAALKDRPYPGLVARDGYFADGKLLYDIDGDALTVIKSWEDAGYIEQTVEVITADGKTEATAFVWQEEITKLTAWNRNEFQKLHLEDYVNIHIPKYLEGYRKSQE